MPLQKVGHLLLVDLQEGDLNLAVGLEQVLPPRKPLIHLVQHSLDYALITAFNHHITGNSCHYTP